MPTVSGARRLAYDEVMSSRGLCAVTGSNGYVGSCVKGFLAGRGWDILEVTRAPKPGTRSTAFQLGSEVDPQAFEGVDALVHCAYDFKPLHWDDIRAVNVLGTEKLFSAARAAGVKHLVCISTISAYQGCKSLYGKAKLEIEQVASTHGALALRPGLVYGTDAGGMFGKLTEQVKASSIVPLIGDGSQIQFLLHHEDLSSFVARHIEGETHGTPGILTAAHDQPWPFRKLLSAIARGLNKKVYFVPLPWRLVWAGLKTAELMGLSLNFRSDSVVSLVHQNPAPDFSRNLEVGLVCRPFSAGGA